MSTITESSGFIGNLSATLGTTEPALRLLLTVLSGYPVALVFRKWIYGHSATVQHLFCILTGFLLGYWNYGPSFFHTIAAIFTSYVILFFIGGTGLSVALVFVFNLAYLLLGYYYVGTTEYDINWTMPQCILVLRLIAIAFDLYDGQQPKETLSKENLKVAIEQCPTLLEFLGHSLFPSSFLVGPQFSIKRYQDFTAGKFGVEGKAPDSEKAAIKRFGLGIVYLAVFQVLGFVVSDEYLLSEDFAQSGYIKRLLLMGLWGRYTLYKYISCWLLTEGACILFGISYNGKDERGETLWNGVENVKLSTFENTTEFNHYILSFNTNTNHWVAQYIYKRLKFLGNRNYSQLGVLLFLAIWHGFHSGYYVCFFFEFIVVLMERDVKSLAKNNETLSNLFANPSLTLPISIVLRLYTFILMGWCLMPFALLSFPRYWKAFGAVNHIGSLIFILYHVLYGPVLKLIFKKKREKPQ